MTEHELAAENAARLLGATHYRCEPDSIARTERDVYYGAVEGNHVRVILYVAPDGEVVRFETGVCDKSFYPPSQWTELDTHT